MGPDAVSSEIRASSGEAERTGGVRVEGSDGEGSSRGGGGVHGSSGCGGGGSRGSDWGEEKGVGACDGVSFCCLNLLGGNHMAKGGDKGGKNVGDKRGSLGNIKINPYLHKTKELIRSRKATHCRRDKICSVLPELSVICSPACMTHSCVNASPSPMAPSWLIGWSPLSTALLGRDASVRSVDLEGLVKSELSTSRSVRSSSQEINPLLVSLCSAASELCSG